MLNILTASNISCLLYRVLPRRPFKLEFITYHTLLFVASFFICVRWILPPFNQLRAFMRVAWVNKLISHIASYCKHCARSKSPRGLNVLFSADRFQSNIDDILSGSSNHTVHSHYNSSIADAQLHVSSFLSELVSIRDSRQSVLGHVAFTKADLADITQNISATQLFNCFVVPIFI